MFEVKIANEETLQQTHASVKNVHVDVKSAQELLDQLTDALADLSNKTNQISESAGGLWCGNAAGSGDLFILETGLELNELTPGHKLTFFTDRFSNQPEIKVDNCLPFALNAKIRGMGVITMAFAEHHFYCETAQIHDDLDGLHEVMNGLSADMGTTKIAAADASVKIGTTGDAAGTTTLFARLNQIYSHLSLNLSASRAGYIDTIKTTTDTLNTKTGANSDAAGTTTLFARLNQIYTYLTTNLSTTRAGYIDTIRSDVATIKASTSSSSSMVSKYVTSFGSGAKTANFTAFEVTKAGRLKSFLLRLSNIPTGNPTITIYLDGVSYYSFSNSSAGFAIYTTTMADARSRFFGSSAPSTVTPTEAMNLLNPICWGTSLRVTVTVPASSSVTLAQSWAEWDESI